MTSKNGVKSIADHTLIHRKTGAFKAVNPTWSGFVISKKSVDDSADIIVSKDSQLVNIETIMHPCMRS